MLEADDMDGGAPFADLVSFPMLPRSLVVLLDEAEVFLQERSLTDLNRNALVSGTYGPN